MLRERLSSINQMERRYDALQVEKRKVQSDISLWHDHL